MCESVFYKDKALPGSFSECFIVPSIVKHRLHVWSRTAAAGGLDRATGASRSQDS